MKCNITKKIAALYQANTLTKPILPSFPRLHFHAAPMRRRRRSSRRRRRRRVRRRTVRKQEKV
jgi:hypothetical protein